MKHKERDHTPMGNYKNIFDFDVKLKNRGIGLGASTGVLHGRFVIRFSFYTLRSFTYQTKNQFGMTGMWHLTVKLWRKAAK